MNNKLLQNENLDKVFNKYFSEKEDITIYFQDYPMNNMNNIVMSLNTKYLINIIYLINQEKIL